MDDKLNQEATGRDSRQMLALLKVVGDLAGVSNEFIAAYATQHLKMRFVDHLSRRGRSPEEAKLDRADFNLSGVAIEARLETILDLLLSVQTPLGNVEPDYWIGRAAEAVRQAMAVLRRMREGYAAPDEG